MSRINPKWLYYKILSYSINIFKDLMPVFIDALKEYNKNEVKWTVPKKGTNDYIQVMKIMNDIKSKQSKVQQNKKKPKTATMP